MTGIDDAYKKYQQVNLQKQAEAIRTGQSQTITSNDIGPIRSESASDREAAMKDEATRKIATNAYVRAQNDAMAEALSTGKPVELTQSRVAAAKEKVLDSYTTSRTPDITIIGPGGKNVIPGTRTISVPVGENEARSKALNAAYSDYQRQNLGLQKKYLDQRANTAQGAKNNPAVTYTKHYTVALEDRLSGGPYNYSVNLNDSLSANKQETQEQKKPANPIDDLYAGTIGAVGQFLSGGMRAFYEKIGYKDVGERGARHFEDLLGIDRKNPSVGAGGLIIGAGTGALATASGDSERAKKEQENVEYAKQYATEHPIGFAAATAIDVLPAIFGARLGKGGSVEPTLPKPASSKFIQRAFADEAPLSSKPAEPPVDNVSFVEIKPIASKPIGSTSFENNPVILSGGLVKNIEIPATAKPFTNESINLGTGSGRLTQIPPFENVTVDLGKSSSTGLGSGLTGGGGKPSTGTGPKFTPTQNIKPEDFGFKESKGSDGTVTLQKLEDLTTVAKPKPQETKVQPKASPAENIPQQSDKLRNLLGIPTTTAKPKPRISKSKPADVAALQSLINPVIQTTGQKRKQKVQEKTETVQLLQAQEATTSTSQQAQDLGISLAVRQTALMDIQSRAKTKQKSTMSGFSQTGQRQNTAPTLDVLRIPGQGSRVTTKTIPTFTPGQVTDIIRMPPPGKPPTRVPPPPSPPNIKLPPPPKLGDGSFGLLSMRRPRKIASDVDKLGVANPFYTPLSIAVKPTKGAVKRHGSGGIFTGGGKVGDSEFLGIGSFEKEGRRGGKGRKKKERFTLF